MSMGLKNSLVHQTIALDDLRWSFLGGSKIPGEKKLPSNVMVSSKNFVPGYLGPVRSAFRPWVAKINIFFISS